MKHQKLILDKITSILEGTDSGHEEKLVQLLDGASRIFLAGAGRSGLITKFFAMRLVHSGYDVSLVGEVVTPSIKSGDLLLIISGSGETKQLAAFADKAKAIGAKIVLISAKSGSTIGEMSEAVLNIGTPDMYTSVKGMPMGTVFELSTLIFLESLVSHLIHEKGIPEEEMQARHANLE